MTTERERIAAELAKYTAEYLPLSDDEIRAEMLKWKEHTPGYRAGEQILKERDNERDPTRKLIADLASRVANIEQHSSKREFKTWAFWISIVSTLIAGAALWIAYSQSRESSHGVPPRHQREENTPQTLRQEVQSQDPPNYTGMSSPSSSEPR
jgi:cytoskeletal protein RodZ